MDTLVAVAEEMMDTQDPGLSHQDIVPQNTMSENDMDSKMDIMIMTNTFLVEPSQPIVPQSQSIKDKNIPMDSVKCLVCDFNVTSSTRYDVFCTLLPKSGNLLCDVMNKVLRTNFVDTTDTMRTLVLCEVCLNLFNDLETAEIQCRKLRTTLIEDYRKTCELYGEFLDDASYGVACQTDLLASDILLNVKQENIIPTTRSKSKRPKRTTTRKTKAKTKKKYETSDEESIDYDRDMSPPPAIDHDDSDREDAVSITMDYSDIIVKPDPDGESDSATVATTRPTVKDKRKKRNRRTHPCEHCSRKFRSQAEVKNHILVKHLDQNPNECVFCQKKLNSRNGLFSHLKNVHNIGYSDRKELISNLNEDLSESEVDKQLLVKQQKILESTIAHSDTDYEPGDGSQSEAQGYESGEQSSGTKRTRRTRSRSRTSQKDQKENLGSRSNQGGVKGGAKVVTVKYLSEEGIGEEAYVVKEEGDDPVEGEPIEKDDNEEEKPRPKKAPRKRNRAPRIGERACMPLIHECPTCGKKWRTVSELNAHKQTHSDLRPFVCEICGQGYKMKKALLVHVGMHNGIHPFTCSYCNKSFTQKVGLEKHMYIHTQTRRFQCDLCGKGFIHLKSYQIHKMIHSGERHIKCQVCGLALLSKSHLKQHLRVHTGERPHECDACGKRFAKKSNLNAHKKKVHHIVHTPPVMAPVVMPATEAVGVPVLPLPELLPALNGLPVQNQDQAVIVVVKEDQDPVSASPHKCQMCPFTSNRKQSLQEHWERDHNRYLNTYTGEYEQFTM